MRCRCMDIDVPEGQERAHVVGVASRCLQLSASGFKKSCSVEWTMIVGRAENVTPAAVLF